MAPSLADPRLVPGSISFFRNCATAAPLLAGRLCVYGILKTVIYNNKIYTKKVLRTAAFSIWGLFILSFLAIHFNIYYTFPWFDMLMHFLGGMIAALVLYVILARFDLRYYRTAASFFIAIVVMTFLVGLFWEVAEYVVNYYLPTYAFDPIDTTIDLVADTCGAALSAAFIFIRKRAYDYGNN